jgi:hypothetical protein
VEEEEGKEGKEEEEAPRAQTQEQQPRQKVGVEMSAGAEEVEVEAILAVAGRAGARRGKSGVGGQAF